MKNGGGKPNGRSDNVKEWNGSLKNELNKGMDGMDRNGRKNGRRMDLEIWN